MKLQKSFYARCVMASIQILMILTAIFYIGIDESEFGVVGEICKETEEITGFCLEYEEIVFEKINPILIFLLLVIVSFSLVMNIKELKSKYKIAKYGTNWRDKI